MGEVGGGHILLRTFWKAEICFFQSYDLSFPWSSEIPPVSRLSGEVTVMQCFNCIRYQMSHCAKGPKNSQERKNIKYILSHRPSWIGPHAVGHASPLMRSEYRNLSCPLRAAFQESHLGDRKHKLEISQPHSVNISYTPLWNIHVTNDSV